MPFLIVRNDITNMQTDAIVNPANETLAEGSGTSKAIYVAAGEEQLTKACEKIGHCDLGDAVITNGFNLNTRYIIHAVGPIWKDGLHNEEKLLYSAYMSSLTLAHENKCESVSFPLLSSGNYGYPKDKAMKVAISAISDFLMEYEMMVYMVLYDKESFTISRKLFNSISEYIDDNYVEEKNENHNRFDKIEKRDLREAEHIARVQQSLEVSRKCMSIPKEKNLDNCRNLECFDEEKIENSDILYEEKSLTLKEISVMPQRTLDSLVNNPEETFSQMLLRLIDERGLKDSTVYKKANVDRRHFSKIRNDINYTPSKKTVLAFAIALELSLDEAVDLMNKAGYAFSKSSKFDIIINFFIENHKYDIYEINEVLFTYDQQILG